MSLKDKKFILGITGSIAAYKAAILIRLLIKEGAQVKVIMTPLAKEFITPVTLATLSKNTVLSDFFKHDDGEWNSHVDLGIWADMMLIAPTTSNTMAKMANGICDNLLLTTYLSARCPVMHVPAMDMDMFRHPATIKNMETLRSYGNIFVEPSSGELASGLHGKGRMEDPEKIVEVIKNYFSKKKTLIGKNILVTAGPTIEKIDPVRYIGNSSSGKMGYAIAENLASKGAIVQLISGPVNIAAPSNPNIILTKVSSAQEMYKATIKEYPNTNAAIFAAAVADYTPIVKHDKKLKKQNNNLTIELKENPDIAAECGNIKKKNQINIGFALETNDEKFNAEKKLKSKNFDFIVLNSLNDTGAGFNHDTNKISIIDKNNNIDIFELKSKKDVAEDIVNKTIEHLK